MAIVDVGHTDLSTSVGFSDVAHGVGVDKWEIARFVFDWGLILVPGGAIVSGARKASYIRKGYKVVKEAPKGGRLTALEAYVVGRPIRSTLFVGGSVGTVAFHPATNPLYYQGRIAGEAGSYIFGQYIDHEGKLRTFLPSGQILSGLGGYTSRTGTEARSFSDMNGLGLLKSISTPTPETFPEVSESRKRALARRRSRSDSSKPPAPGRGGRNRRPPWWEAKRRISRKRS